MKNQKKLIILTGPSGVGKGTVVKEILGKDKNIWLSISATTREPREGEKEGENYYFLNQEKFKEMICLLYTSPSPRDKTVSRMPSSA